MSVSKTQLKKLNMYSVQKVASERVICRVPRDAHSKPLLEALELESLESRINADAVQLTEAILAGSTHPALAGLFSRGADGATTNTSNAHTRVGEKRLSICARNIYNGTLP